MSGDKKPFPVAQTKFDELFATFSPDGKYIAYQSNESGRAEVYVQEFPEARNKWQVSTERRQRRRSGAATARSCSTGTARVSWPCPCR